ncbi:MAG TPA: PIN domain-containing protein [Dissulfurispiraceae bacterium]
MSDKVFLDANILVYAHDKDAGEKHSVALTIVKDLWEKRTGVLSNQVLQEFYVGVTRKIQKSIAKSEAREILRAYLCWSIREITPLSIVRATEIEEKNRISFWDALVIVAAYEAKCEKILTEDLNAGQVIEGILIENPFKR